VTQEGRTATKRRVNWSRALGNVGRTLIGTGTLILLFVVYQLWGTALFEQRAQNELRSEFTTALEERFGAEFDQISLDALALPASLEATEVVQAVSIADDTDAPTQAIDLTPTDVLATSILPAGLLSDEYGAPPPPAEDGDAVAEIRIPRIGITKTVVEGVSTDVLKAGPGHYPGTPLPGQAGNAAIAGHRTTYGAPFFRLDELEENDLIYVTTLQGSFVYRVVEQKIVAPKDVYVLDPTIDNRLTLTTCHPRYSARQRLIIVAELIGEPAESDPSQIAAPGELELPSENFPDSETAATAPPTSADPPDPELLDIDEVAVAVPATTSTTQAPVQTEVAQIRQGIDGERGDQLPAILWGLFAATMAFAIWYLAQSWRKLPSYALGAPVFLVVLFFFFEAFSSLLPPGV